jgi:hypothetical protein
MTRLALLAFALLCVPAAVKAADPLDSVPASAQAVIVSDDPRKLAEAITTLDAFKDAQKLGPVRQVYDSATVRRYLRMLGFAEKMLGAKWQELLDQLGGNGVALAFQLGNDAAPAILVVEAKDEEQLTKAMALGVQVIDEELARQGVPQRVKWTKLGDADAASVGDDIHFARVGTTVLVSNKAEGIKAAIEQRAAGRSRPHKARADAAKALPKNPLAWVWLDFAAVKESKQAKDFFDSSRGQFLFTLVAGATIDCLRRADFVAAGLYRESNGFRLAVRIPAGRDGLWDELAMHVPPKGTPGSLPLLESPGTIYSQSMHLDIGYMWKHRDVLITGDDKKNFEMAEKQVSKILPGSVKLGELLEMWGPHHRVVVVNHDTRPYKREPALKLPAFGYVATMRDKKFGTTADIVGRSIGVVGSLQFGLKMTEYDIDGVTLVGYRFPENKELDQDPDGVRFNFEPCFAVVGDELVVASTVELGKKLIAELKKPSRGEASPAVIRAKGNAREAAAALAGFSEPLITDAVLGRGIGLADARQEVADIIAFVKTLGTAQVELDIADTEYRVNVVWAIK